MSPASPVSASQDRTTAIIYGVVGSLIATAIVACGAWLAGRQVPDETALNFISSEIKVDKLSAWHIRIANNSDVAFDLQITPPSSKIIRFEYAPKGNDTAKGNDAQIWKGQIAKGRVVEALYVSDDPNVRLSPAVVQSSITATYQERNPLTGVIENRVGEVRETGAFTLVRTALLIFWFVLPALMVSGLLLLPRVARGIRERWRSLKKNTRP